MDFPAGYMSSKHERGCSTEGIDAFTPGMDGTVGARAASAKGVPRDS
jgi:hypothetical protein